MQKMAQIIQKTQKSQNNRNKIGLNSKSPKRLNDRQKSNSINSFHKMEKKNTLNFEKRLRDHKQIITENQAILHRL